MQKFPRISKSNKYEERTLVEEFKRGINGTIRRKLIKTERPPTSIKQ